MDKRVTGMVIAAVIALTCVVGCVNDSAQSNGGGQAPVVDNGIKQSVNEYSWEELSGIAEQISASESTETALDIAKKYNLTNEEGALDGTQTKAIQLDDGASATVQIVGFYHDDLTGTGKAGITFMTGNVVARQSVVDSYADPLFWETSSIRSWLATDMLDRLPSDLSSLIMPVDKITNNSGLKTGDVSSTSDQLWLFSGVELCGLAEWTSDDESNEVLNAEGEQYKLFADTGVSKSGSNAILAKNGEDDSWWIRPTTCSSSFVRCVDSHGSVEANNVGSTHGGVVFGFCI